MPPLIRRATAQDILRMVGLLVRDAEQRGSLDPAWALTADSTTRIESAFHRGLAGSSRGSALRGAGARARGAQLRGSGEEAFAAALICWLRAPSTTGTGDKTSGRNEV